MKYIFYTKLSIDECIVRITKNAEKMTIPNLFSMLWDYEKGFFYTIKGHKFSLEKVIYYRNSFKPFFYGKLTKHNRGTMIEGHFSMHWFVRLFMAVWFVGMALIGGGIVVASIEQLFMPVKTLPITFTGNAIMGIIFPFFMLAFGVGIVKIGQQMGRKHERETIEFIEEKLEAELQKK